MIKYICKLMFLLSLINNSWALPWFHSAEELINTKSLKTHSPDISPVNFSGIWIGECNNSPALDSTIQHDANQISLSYGYLKEKYNLGEVKSAVSSKLSASETNNTTALWNTDQRAIVFINYNMFLNGVGTLHVFFSRVSMTMDAGELVVAGRQFHVVNNLDTFEEEALLCRYHRK